MGAFPMILVTISEGKNFPVRYDKKLIVEAKFDGEVMGSEPVPHVTFPQIQTEFAWEVDKKGLQMHRLQRTPIKLLWYAVDQELMRKESIGYIILDLRLASERDLAPSWYPLLNSKYHREKPEVKIRLSLEKEGCQKEPNVRKDAGFNSSQTYTVNELRDLRRQPSNDAIPKVAPPAVPSSKLLQPVLLPESVGYQIGPPDQCHENFSFSITLAFAANLNKLANPSLLRSSKDYYFYYSLFDNDVNTGRFTSLLNPDFRAERASVKICSSSELLSSYFQQHSHLEVILYCGDVPLASGNILLHQFASLKHHNIDKESLSIEDNVKLHSLLKPSRLPTSDDLSPFVGVTVVLQKDNDANTPEKPATPPKSNGTFTRASSLSERDTAAGDRNGEINGNGTIHKDAIEMQSQAVLNWGRTKYLQHQHSLNGGRDLVHNGSFIPSLLPTVPTKVTQVVGTRNTSPWIMNGNHPVNDNVPCHFCFSLDICNFCATHLEQPVNIFIRYSYPFFGNSSSISSKPDVEVLPGSSVNILGGYCSFTFSTTIGVLKSIFRESPLILEMVHRKRISKTEHVIGHSRLNLSQIFNSALTPQHDGKRQGTRQMCTSKCLVITPDGHELGELSIIMMLDDFGPSSPLCDKYPTKMKVPTFSQLRSSISSYDVPSMKANGLTQEQLQAAVDLEIWREQQKEVFRAELKEKEIQHIKVLLAEWKQRDKDREDSLKRRIQDYEKLENKVKLKLRENDLQEKQLITREAELSLRLQSWEKEKEQYKNEMKLEMEKLRIEYEDILSIEKASQHGFQKTIFEMERQLHNKGAEILEHRNAIESLRAQANKPPDAELKTEVNILKMEKAELKEKFEAATASKQKYKAQWGQQMRHTSVLQQKISALERLLLEKTDQAFTNAHVYGSEKQLAKLPGQVMSKMTERVNGLQLSKKSSEEQDQESPSSTSESLAATNPAPAAKDSKGIAGMHAEELKAQKDNLLNSGMYSEMDGLIQTLNMYIDKAKQIPS